MTRVLVFTGVDLEARSLARHLGLARDPGTAWLHYRTGGVEIACVGPGGGRLDEGAARFEPPDLVVSAGACGALSPDLAAGDLVVPEVVVTADGAREPTAPLPVLAPRGALLSVDEVVATAAAKSRLWLETGALAVDMESAAVLRWARARGLPAAVVRGVSDPAARAVPPDLAALVMSDGSVRTSAAVRVALARPRALIEAMALRSGTSVALRAVARALARIVRAR